MEKKALFAISTLGLGHATRTLPIIKHYLKQGYHLDIVCFGNALNYLKTELHGEKVRFFELIDYPALERGSWRSFYIMLISDLLTTYIRIRREQKLLKKLEKKTEYSFIFSDGKYGFFSKKTKSFLLTHQLSFHIPKIFSFSQKFMDYFNKKYFQKFARIFIPDYKDSKHNLAGKLSHPGRINEVKHNYVGVISSFWWKENKEKSEPIDYLFTISWYLAQHRGVFIQKLLNEAKTLPWKKVFILWDTTQKEYYQHDTQHNIEIYWFLAGEEKIKRFLSAKTIISRAGYTTIMDLVELEKPAILLPTPNQTEQLYLSGYLWAKKYFVSGNDNDQLSNLISKLSEIQPFKTKIKTEQALETIYKYLDQ